MTSVSASSCRCVIRGALTGPFSPHLLVLHDPKTRTSHWVHVTKEAVTSTGNGFKVLVSAVQRVDATSRESLLDVAASAESAIAASLSSLLTLPRI